MDKFSYHEVLDRTHVLVSVLDDHILTHPVIENDPELKKKAEEAEASLGELYQLIGQKIDTKFPKVKKDWYLR